MPRYVVIDATGLRAYGAGEWRVWKHRVRRRRMAQPYPAKDPREWRAIRNRVLQQIAVHGRSPWRGLSGYTRQSIAENTMFRFKQLFAGSRWARGWATQRTEVRIKYAVLNRMTRLGMPETMRVE